MNLAVIINCAFGLLVGALITWPIAKASGRRELKKEYKAMENAKTAPDKI